ncbi:hypothetical protein FRB91_005155, partial [Serendipita sp. 411]
RYGVNILPQLQQYQVQQSRNQVPTQTQSASTISSVSSSTAAAAALPQTLLDETTKKKAPSFSSLVTNSPDDDRSLIGPPLALPQPTFTVAKTAIHRHLGLLAPSRPPPPQKRVEQSRPTHLSHSISPAQLPLQHPLPEKPTTASAAGIGHRQSSRTATPDTARSPLAPAKEDQVLQEQSPLIDKIQSLAKELTGIRTPDQIKRNGSNVVTPTFTLPTTTTTTTTTNASSSAPPAAKPSPTPLPVQNSKSTTTTNGKGKEKQAVVVISFSSSTPVPKPSDSSVTSPPIPLPLPSSSIQSNPTVPLPSVVDRMVHENTHARFGDGLKVEMITTPFEPRRITVVRIPVPLPLPLVGGSKESSSSSSSSSSPLIKDLRSPVAKKEEEVKRAEEIMRAVFEQVGTVVRCEFSRVGVGDSFSSASQNQPLQTTTTTKNSGFTSPSSPSGTKSKGKGIDANTNTNTNTNTNMKGPSTLAAPSSSSSSFSSASPRFTSGSSGSSRPSSSENSSCSTSSSLSPSNALPTLELIAHVEYAHHQQAANAIRAINENAPAGFSIPVFTTQSPSSTASVALQRARQQQQQKSSNEKNPQPQQQQQSQSQSQQPFTLPSTLSASFSKTIAPNQPSTTMVSDTVLIRWDIPRPRIRVYYKEGRVARRELEVINRRMFFGRKLLARFFGASKNVILVEGVSIPAGAIAAAAAVGKANPGAGGGEREDGVEKEKVKAMREEGEWEEERLGEEVREFRRRHCPDGEIRVFDDGYVHEDVMQLIRGFVQVEEERTRALEEMERTMVGWGEETSMYLKVGLKSFEIKENLNPSGTTTTNNPSSSTFSFTSTSSSSTPVVSVLSSSSKPEPPAVACPQGNVAIRVNFHNSGAASAFYTSLKALVASFRWRRAGRLTTTLSKDLLY